jgi:GNAT superfamily N-acetyltransferase
MTDPVRTIDAGSWRHHPGIDLNLELPGGPVLALAWLDWDSRFFGLPCYRLRAERCYIPDGATDGKGLRQAAKDFPRCAVWAKVPPRSHPALAAALQALGGEFVETELTLGHDGRKAEPAAVEGVHILKTEDLNRPGFPELGRVFSLTRFHTDPRIGKERADALWTEYLKNYHLSEDRHAFMAEAGGRIVGAVLVSADRAADKPVNGLDIVAVAPSHTGRGVGRALIRSTLDWSFTTGRNCTVATQHRNIDAIAFYQRNGFCHLVSATPVFHLWTAGRGDTP